jgi:hypothetical protein
MIGFYGPKRTGQWGAVDIGILIGAILGNLWTTSILRRAPGNPASGFANQSALTPVGIRFIERPLYLPQPILY